MDNAVHWASLSAFSNAGQRCSSGSILLVFDGVYKKFRDQLVQKAKSLVLGTHSGCDLGPVINARQQQNIFASITAAMADGGKLLCGGNLAPTHTNPNGFYVEPTIIEGLSEVSELNATELFGPVASIQSITEITEALKYINAQKYGLTCAIHTSNIDRAMWFAHRVRTGVANINLGTFGSEPHMPFGGYGLSGNGTREPGIEALDVYSEIKNISILTRESLI